jgi:transcriptional regulator with XRE-family HTH domain
MPTQLGIYVANSIKLSGFTQKQVAEKIGITETHLSRMLKREKISDKLLMQIAQVIGVKYEALIRGQGATLTEEDVETLREENERLRKEVDEKEALVGRLLEANQTIEKLKARITDYRDEIDDLRKKKGLPMTDDPNGVYNAGY